jgi:hypothetical protein
MRDDTGGHNGPLKHRSVKCYLSLSARDDAGDILMGHSNGVRLICNDVIVLLLIRNISLYLNHSDSIRLMVNGVYP